MDKTCSFQFLCPSFSRANSKFYRTFPLHAVLGPCLEESFYVTFSYTNTHWRSAYRLLLRESQTVLRASIMTVRCSSQRNLILKNPRRVALKTDDCFFVYPKIPRALIITRVCVCGCVCVCVCCCEKAGFVFMSLSFGGLVVIMLASGTQVRGFKPGQSRRIFRAKTSSTYLSSEGK
jgi:hypothetical protein